MKRKLIPYFSALLVLFSQGVNAQMNLTSSMLNEFKFRNLGAYRAGAWVSAIALPENPGEKYKYAFFVAGRNGGVWKTVNNDTTFYPVFEKYGVTSIGAIAVAPSNPDVVWVRTGESYNARSSYAGNGIYKSTDGG
jgi:acyl-homoserine lactone acylase PvdQ